jgi:hypothetical protein
MSQLFIFLNAWPLALGLRYSRALATETTEREFTEMPNQSTGEAGPPSTVAEPQAIENASGAVLLFVAGMTAGVALGLMVAPASGASSRRGVGRKLRESADWMKSKAAGAEQGFLTQSAGLRDGIKAAAGTVR